MDLSSTVSHTRGDMSRETQVIRTSPASNAPQPNSVTPMQLRRPEQWTGHTSGKKLNVQPFRHATFMCVNRKSIITYELYQDINLRSSWNEMDGRRI